MGVLTNAGVDGVGDGATELIRREGVFVEVAVGDGVDDFGDGVGDAYILLRPLVYNADTSIISAAPL